MKRIIDKRYLKLPIGYRALNKRVEIWENGELLWEFNAAIDWVSPDYYQYLCVDFLLGRELEWICYPKARLDFEMVDEPDKTSAYKESYRPQIHFTPEKGWLNDPNGLVYAEGTYHMFFQHNPAGHWWSNISWGHAVSRDLLHWEQKDPALYPDDFGYMYSGSAIVDKENCSGLKAGNHDPILLFYTACANQSEMSSGKSTCQCMAYSLDGGVSFKKYEHNPIIPHIEGDNRDPKVVYCHEIGRYVLALYLAEDRYVLFVSNNLLQWEEWQRLSLPGDGECPDFFSLFLDEDPLQKRWIFIGASDHYLVGSVQQDGFVSEGEPRRLHYGRNSYAAQSFSDIPEKDGRRIRMAWNTFEFQHSPFNCAMCFPTEMTLKSIDGKPQLCVQPANEIQLLHGAAVQVENRLLTPSECLKVPLKGKSHEIRMDMEANQESLLYITLLGMQLEIDFQHGVLKLDDREMPLYLQNGRLTLTMITDTNGIEIFTGLGQAHLCMGRYSDYNGDEFELITKKDNVNLVSFKLIELKSAL